MALAGLEYRVTQADRTM
jgi:penicillin-binding protein 2